MERIDRIYSLYRPEKERGEERSTVSELWKRRQKVEMLSAGQRGERRRKESCTEGRVAGSRVSALDLFCSGAEGQVSEPRREIGDVKGMD